MRYFDVIFLSDVISSIGPTISDAETIIIILCQLMIWKINCFSGITDLSILLIDINDNNYKRT